MIYGGNALPLMENNNKKNIYLLVGHRCPQTHKSGHVRQVRRSVLEPTCVALLPKQQTSWGCNHYLW